MPGLMLGSCRAFIAGHAWCMHAAKGILGEIARSDRGGDAVLAFRDFLKPVCFLAPSTREAAFLSESSADPLHAQWMGCVPS